MTGHRRRPAPSPRMRITMVAIARQAMDRHRLAPGPRTPTDDWAPTPTAASMEPVTAHHRTMARRRPTRRHQVDAFPPVGAAEAPRVRTRQASACPLVPTEPNPTEGHTPPLLREPKRQLGRVVPPRPFRDRRRLVRRRRRLGLAAHPRPAPPTRQPRSRAVCRLARTLPIVRLQDGASSRPHCCLPQASPPRSNSCMRTRTASTMTGCPQQIRH